MADERAYVYVYIYIYICWPPVYTKGVRACVFTYIFILILFFLFYVNILNPVSIYCIYAHTYTHKYESGNLGGFHPCRPVMAFICYANETYSNDSAAAADNGHKSSGFVMTYCVNRVKIKKKFK